MQVNYYLNAKLNKIKASEIHIQSKDTQIFIKIFLKKVHYRENK